MRQSDWSLVSGQHDAIIHALEERNGPRLKALLVEHLEAAWSRAKSGSLAAGAKRLAG